MWVFTVGEYVCCCCFRRKCWRLGHFNSKLWSRCGAQHLYLSNMTLRLYFYFQWSSSHQWRFLVSESHECTHLFLFFIHAGIGVQLSANIGSSAFFFIQLVHYCCAKNCVCVFFNPFIISFNFVPCLLTLFDSSLLDIDISSVPKYSMNRFEQLSLGSNLNVANIANAYAWGSTTSSMFSSWFSGD